MTTKNKSELMNFIIGVCAVALIVLISINWPQPDKKVNVDRPFPDSLYLVPVSNDNISLRFDTLHSRIPNHIKP